jgi:hypothetical protein
MDAVASDADFGLFGMLLSGLLLECEQLQAFAVGVSDPEPWRRIGVAVTNRRVLWIDDRTATAVSVTRDAVTRVAFLAFDAPPRPIYFDVEIDGDVGVVSVRKTASAEQQAVGWARSALVHEWIDTVRFTTNDAQRLEGVFFRRSTDDGGALHLLTQVQRNAVVVTAEADR